MFNRIDNILHPERYHGHHAHPPFFEGWYYKLVDKSEKHRYAIIPGISLGNDANDRHAFVQVLNGITGESAYHTYPIQDFWAAEKAFYVIIGPNHFTQGSLKLDLPENGLSLKGEAVFYDLVTWPVNPIAPGIMGWYAWIPKMECYHGVLSMDHAIHGNLKVNGTPIEFTDGRGYIEKDWGQSFPSGWVWMQSNHFSKTGVSLTASVAMIPWIGQAFRGFIVGLWHENKLYRFATYTGAAIEHLDIQAQDVSWTIRDRKHRLTITAHRHESGILRGPSKEKMNRRVPETLDATVDVKLITVKDNNIIFEGSGRNAAMEIAGNTTSLTD